MFRFPGCFLSQIMYFQQVELLLKEEMKVSGFFPNLLLMFSQECLENRHICKYFSPFRAVFLSLLCTLDTPAPGK